MNYKHFARMENFLTNGEISVKMIAEKTDFGLDLPDGVIYGQDNKGNQYLNGKPAWVETRESCNLAFTEHGLEF